MINSTFKICSKCNQSKPIEEFPLTYRKEGQRRSDCKACILARSKEWRDVNKETVNAQARVRNASNKNKAQHRERVRRYKRIHPDKKKAENVRRRSKLKNIIADLTTEQWEAIKLFYNFRCAYCNEAKDLTQDHVIPIAKDGHHTASNIVPACQSCNSSKGDRLIKPSVMHSIN